MDDEAKRKMERIRDVVLGGSALPSVNRITCDCQHCHWFALHTVTIDLDGRIVERHLCQEHFEFLSHILPHMEQSPPEFPLRD